MSKIKTTHVGSLPRSNELSDLLFKKDQKEKIDLNQFDEIVKRDVDNIVKKQLEVGIDYISDGEMSKISYATYVKDRIDGFSGESERKAPKDLDDFPSFKERIARTGGTPTYTRPCCTSELKIKDKTNGLKLQLDCPDLALARHMTFKDLSEEEFLIRAEKQIECLNNAISNIDSSKIRMHICWGNYEGPHLHDIALEKIMPIALKANIQTYLIESSNPRHSHEWQIFENLKIPKDKIIAPGVIDSTTNFVEHPEVVKNRIVTYSKVIEKDQLVAGTDCGFSTFAGFGNVDENIVYKKLESLVLGAELASKVI